MEENRTGLLFVLQRQSVALIVCVTVEGLAWTAGVEFLQARTALALTPTGWFRDNNYIAKVVGDCRRTKNASLLFCQSSPKIPPSNLIQYLFKNLNPQQRH